MEEKKKIAPKTTVEKKVKPTGEKTTTEKITGEKKTAEKKATEKKTAEKNAAEKNANDKLSEKDNGEKKIKVTLVRSVIGTKESHRATVRGLGLKWLNHSVVLADTPAVRGMINKVSYLIRAEAQNQKRVG